MPNNIHRIRRKTLYSRLFRFFMALQGKEYAISDSYVAIREDVLEILRILHVLKNIIIKRVSEYVAESWR